MHARLSDDGTTIEHVLLHAEKYKGEREAQGGLGAHGETPFLLCALKNHLEHRLLMRFLLAHYASPEVSHGATSRRSAVGPGTTDADGPVPGLSGAKKLRKLVCAAYEGAQFHGETALHFAVVHGDHEMANQLLDAGADVDAQADGLFFYERVSTYFGGPPVGLAAKLGDLPLVELLAARGANLYFVDEGCLTTINDKADEWRQWHLNVKRLLSRAPGSERNLRRWQWAGRAQTMSPEDGDAEREASRAAVDDAKHMAADARKLHLAAGDASFCRRGIPILRPPSTPLPWWHVARPPHPAALGDTWPALLIPPPLVTRGRYDDPPRMRDACQACPLCTARSQPPRANPFAQRMGSDTVAHGGLSGTRVGPSKGARTSLSTTPC